MHKKIAYKTYLCIVNDFEKTVIIRSNGMNENGRKLKILYILQLLYRHADEKEPLSIEKIIAELAKKGITAERKSIYSDIAALREFGVEIVAVKSKSVGYYIKNKVFSESDLASLWDSVHATGFISGKRCDELKKKIEYLASEREKKQIRRRVYTVNRAFRQPEQYVENLNTVHNAIAEKKQISFVYEEGVTEGRKAKKTAYCASPYIVICRSGSMMLIAGCPELEGLNHFYIDRIESVSVLPDKITDVREFVGDMEFDLMCYSRGLFDSYSPDSVTVTLRINEDMINTVVGTFGKTVTVKPYGGIASGLYSATFDTEISQELLSWLFLNSATVHAVAPQELVNALKDAARDVYIKYCN